MKYVTLTKEERASRVAQTVKQLKFRALISIILLLGYLLIFDYTQYEDSWLIVADLLVAVLVVTYLLVGVVTFAVIELILPSVRGEKQSIMLTKREEVLHFNITRGKDKKLPRLLAVKDIEGLQVLDSKNGAYTVTVAYNLKGEKYVVVLELAEGDTGVPSFIYEVNNKIKYS